LGGATAGTYKLAADFEGLSGTTDAIAFDASNATIQAALEAIRPIKTGNVVVAGTTPKSITFGGNLAKANLPLLTIVTIRRRAEPASRLLRRPTARTNFTR
jgi:hypothetical protein